MLRLRRSRVVIFLTLVTCFLFYNLYAQTQAYKLVASYTSRPAQHPAGHAGHAAQEAAKLAEHHDAVPPPAAPQVTTTEAALKAIFEEQKTLVQAAQTAQTTAAPANKGDHPGLDLDTGLPPKAHTTKPVADIDPEAFGKALGGPPQYGSPEEATRSSSATTSTTTDVHWSKMPEHFPVPTESMIPLPTGKSKQLPKVQHSFKDESSLEKGTREKRQAQILKTFKKSWNGYEEYAWLHDELRPKSGGFKDPFCGWAATLVDSLDTLLIMGMEKEFNHALEGLAQIDFTTTTRREIPLFETTIRYLGGLLSAHDLSGHKHKILLEKAVELAEVLMGAFDTPNRMPQTFFSWRPAFVMNPHRAGTRVVMAELGSLSMEFTRLAQLTQDDKYYDAIARITNELDDFQESTKIPGLWPLYIDASGCKKPDSTHKITDILESELRNVDETPQEATTTIVAQPQKGVQHTHEETPAPKFDHTANKGRIGGWDDKEVDRAEAGGKVPTRHGDGPVLGTKAKRQLDSAPKGVPAHDREFDDKDKAGLHEVSLPGNKMANPPKVDCLPQGLASPPGSMTEEFSFGGMADSTYEYLPKQFALLGGAVAQYQSMYEKSIEAANKHLLFRPMTPKNDALLVLAKAKAGEGDVKSGDVKLEPSLEHLLCFAGGMYGLGAKLFDRPKELEIAKQMTDSCVWAYGITPTGIMPESLSLIKCDSLSEEKCQWNETTWEYTMDPYPEDRIADGQLSMKKSAEMAKAHSEEPVAALNDDLDPDSPKKPTGQEGSLRGDTRGDYLKNKAPVGSHQGGELEKRQLDTSERLTGTDSAAGVTKDSIASKPDPVKEKAKDSGRLPPTPTLNFDEVRTLEQADYVKYRMERERLPKGVVAINSRQYILRPEAIESVFYMYRITGDPTWREKGWKMFEAIQAATDTTYGASAIQDVTADGETKKLDAMESFWLAETLKYFYLLFSEESVISLDEWVMNTEAHPFKRPT